MSAVAKERRDLVGELPGSGTVHVGSRDPSAGALAKLLAASRAAGEIPPLRIATRIVSDVLDALDVLHGDVGAHNVVIDADGIAQLVLDGDPGAGLAYAAPELVSGQDVDHRSDVYATAILLFEIATGRRPFEDVPADQLASQIVRGLRPDDLRAARGLPRDVLGVIARGLARRANDRYGSPAEMARALRDAHALAEAHEVAAWAARFTSSSHG